ncbi:hypothetical protein WUBG_16154 [Wuchereria bancrofti]|uniref:Ig-like domain-containing protein n=1 Tax=Wuchereria bancrofti TaxID=6293 RepID=J9EC05_WUCBA|nr:hypothetical protein WUBG_16154 [Wuchereria bancrofti]
MGIVERSKKLSVKLAGHKRTRPPNITWQKGGTSKGDGFDVMKSGDARVAMVSS